MDVYTALKKTGTELEVVFVSSDRSQEGFDEYYSEMPWLVLGTASSTLTWCWTPRTSGALQIRARAA